VGPCHHGKACSQDAHGGDGLQIWRVAALYWINSGRWPTMGGPPAWGWAGANNSSPFKEQHVKKFYTWPVGSFCDHGNEPSNSIKVSSWLTQWLLVSQGGLSSRQFVKLYILYKVLWHSISWFKVTNWGTCSHAYLSLWSELRLIETKSTNFKVKEVSRSEFP